jgi:hypothetical protein
MKIFAKRTKKSAVSTISEADKAIQDILKKDPNDLNAKERRQIKRYHERTGATSDSTANLEPEEQVNEDVNCQQESIGLAIQKDVNCPEPSKDDSSPTDQTPETTPSDESSKVDGKVTNENMESEVRELLEKLNSKNKRKLTRQLDRDGIGVLHLVREEAIQLLNEQKTKEEAIDTARKAKKVPEKAEPESASKKRKREAWNSLSPEERLRREEQRQKQQEAAERREKGEISNTKFTHPLNSERRRANRRKPKWQKKENPNKIDHHTSGFNIRKSSSKINS